MMITRRILFVIFLYALDTYLVFYSSKLLITCHSVYKSLLSYLLLWGTMRVHLLFFQVVALFVNDDGLVFSFVVVNDQQ